MRFVQSFSFVSFAACSFVAFASGCSDEAPPTLAPANTGGTTSSGGTTSGSGGTTATGGGGGGGAVTGTGASDGTGGGAELPPGVPLAFEDGWIAADSNDLEVQGAVFSYADLHSGCMDTYTDGSCATMSETIMGATACIAGEAAKVDVNCDTDALLDPNATDCYGEYWGTAIGMNFNQPTEIDPETEEEVGGDPMAYDAATKGITGIAFELTGTAIPTSMRFTVETEGGEFCTPIDDDEAAGVMEILVRPGVNHIKFSDLFTECWDTKGTRLTDVSTLKKIAWQVVTNGNSTTPFDFCVGQVTAVTE